MGSVAALAVMLVLPLVFPWFVTITRTDAVIILLAMVSIGWGIWTQDGLIVDWIRVTGHIALGFPIFYVTRRLRKYMSPWAIVGVVTLYLAGIVLQVMSQALYAQLATRIMFAVRSTTDALVRGVAGFCLEPSQLSTMATLLAILTLEFEKPFWRKHPRVHLYIYLAAATMLVMARAATGVVLVAVMVIAWVFRVKGYGLVKTAAALGLLIPFAAIRIAGLTPDTGIRALDFAVSLAQNPLVLIQDASLQARLISPELALINLPSYPLGTGSTTVDPAIIAPAWDSPVLELLILPEYKAYVGDYAMGRLLLGDSLAGGFSEIGRGLYRMGLIYVMVLLVLLGIPRRRHYAVLYQIMLISFLVNGSLANSAIWLMLGLVSDQPGERIVSSRARVPSGRI
jgi:hypothetical protein